MIGIKVLQKHLNKAAAKEAVAARTTAAYSFNPIEDYNNEGPNLVVYDDISEYSSD